MRSIRTMTAAALLGGASLVAAGASADEQKKHEIQTQRGTESFSSEEAFLKEIHDVNLREIEMAQLAKERTRNPEVRDFAEMLLQGHRQADQLVKQEAMEKGITLTEVKPKLPELRELSGQAFDVAFLKKNAQAHQQLAPRIQAFQPRIQDAEFKREVARLADDIEAHGRQAQMLLSKIETTPERKGVRGEEQEKGTVPENQPQSGEEEEPQQPQP